MIAYVAVASSALEARTTHAEVLDIAINWNEFANVNLAALKEKM